MLRKRAESGVTPPRMVGIVDPWGAGLDASARNNLRARDRFRMAAVFRSQKRKFRLKVVRSFPGGPMTKKTAIRALAIVAIALPVLVGGQSVQPKASATVRVYKAPT